jgi:hypothetical protein
LNRAHDQWVTAIASAAQEGRDGSLEEVAEAECAAHHPLSLDELRLMREVGGHTRATLERILRDTERQIAVATRMRDLAARELWVRHYGVRTVEPGSAA